MAAMEALWVCPRLFLSTITTPIIAKIDKIEWLIIDGKVTLVDDEGKPLTRVDSLDDHDSEDEVASVDNDMINFLASKGVGYGKPLTRVDSLDDHDSEDEVASVDNDMTNFLASKDVGYGTNSLLEQWKESYGNVDYDYDPYGDDMYECQDIPNKIQDICDNLDIKTQAKKEEGYAAAGFKGLTVLGLPWNSTRGSRALLA
ncbi:hypothetical protein Tco_0939936 [Tanacetum coccineum]|uniref:Uncharacterized protein n=1 Tax=Tanacetum coccineum TaxID=301880 RepID=A0ABQ5DLI6_9ASTR